MQYLTKLKLAGIHLWCDENDKSTEYMIEIMQDLCKIDLDCVMNYLQLPEKEHLKLKDEIVDLTNTFNVL